MAKSLKASAKPRSSKVNVALLGMGMIGSSWLKGLRATGFCDKAIGYDLNSEVMAFGKTECLIDDGAVSPQEAIQKLKLECNLNKLPGFIVLAAPILEMPKLINAITAELTDNLIITDVGSVKGNVAEAAKASLGEHYSNMVLGHPIAGSEKIGVWAANEHLFEHHKIILTPSAENKAEVVELVSQAWQAVGATVETMSIEHHDEVLAATSHLPHLLSYSLVDTLAHSHENKEIFNYAAGGFRDFTRIAASSPKMWHDIFLANKNEVLKTLELFSNKVDELKNILETENSNELMGILTRAKSARDAYSKQLKDVIEEVSTRQK